jgi:hypothetical protein
MSEIKLTGVEVTGLLTKNFNWAYTITEAGELDPSLGVEAPYTAVSIGYTWTPTTPGDRMHIKQMYVTSGARFFAEFEGPGDLAILIRAVAGLEYAGQKLMNPEE